MIVLHPEEVPKFVGQSRDQRRPIHRRIAGLGHKYKRPIRGYAACPDIRKPLNIAELTRRKDHHDIVLRHGLDVAGDSLCFGSSTGNVYLSEDRGETWQCLGNNFPPVYSVRFG